MKYDNPHAVLVRPGSSVFDYKDHLFRWLCLRIAPEQFTVDEALLWVQQAKEEWKNIHPDVLSVDILTIAVFHNGIADGLGSQKIERLTSELSARGGVCINLYGSDFKNAFEVWCQQIEIIYEEEVIWA